MARCFSSAQTAEKWVALPLRPPEKPVHLKHSSSLSQSRLRFSGTVRPVACWYGAGLSRVDVVMIGAPVDVATRRN
jgi:hypothetical protein